MSTVRRRERHDAHRSLVGFLVGDTAYAIQIRAVREIINPISLTAMPNAPVEVIGVADHRGQVVAVVDLRRYFGVPVAEIGLRPKWIVVDAGGGRCVGLVVDKVTEVFGTGGRALRATPEVAGAPDRPILGVTTQDGRLTIVLDTQRFANTAAALGLDGGAAGTETK